MITEKIKKEIDELSHFEMCEIWRFASRKNYLINGENGEYFKRRLFKHFGGFTPEISKELGWKK